MFSSFFADSFNGLNEVVGAQETPGFLYAFVKPTPSSNPSVLTCNKDLLASLGLADVFLKDGVFDNKPFAAVFSGNQLLEGMTPVATRYGGHQFGHWAGQLGDGRAILLGNVLDQQGQRQEVQLKGAGLTPYSRTADGRAVLRSSLREYLCSEAVFHLGIPTTRALCCVLTGDDVLRDMFYRGEPKFEPGAITTRVSPSFLRFGHFEILASTGEWDLLRSLIQFTCGNYFPEFKSLKDEWSEPKVVEWFSEVCKLTARLVCHWQRVGFVHGVLNTDNMSILGVTIDYGPYGWLDNFDPAWTPNTTDFERRRYRFENQPSVAHWNLFKLAQALSCVAQDTSGLEQALASYQQEFDAVYWPMRLAKLGLTYRGEPSDRDLVSDLDAVMTSSEMDMTIFYRELVKFVNEPDSPLTSFDEFIASASYKQTVDPQTRSGVINWLKSYLLRLKSEARSASESVADMRRVNPVFVLRNYIVQECLDELETGQEGKLRLVERALLNPYQADAATLPFFKKRPDWALSRAGCSMLSCSS
jgi:uncharacterized protein YdiU (UPF0061 family)